MLILVVLSTTMNAVRKIMEKADYCIDSFKLLFSVSGKRLSKQKKF